MVVVVAVLAIMMWVLLMSSIYHLHYC